MTASIDQEQLSLIAWPAGEGRSYRVRSVKNGDGLHQFQLFDGNTIVSCQTIPIPEIGHCFQQWTHKNHRVNVKMFATAGRVHIYFVVTDLKHKEIAVYPESLNEKQWDLRLYDEEPNLQRIPVVTIFNKSHLPNWIGWQKTRNDGAGEWIKTYEKSEVGFVRKYSVYNQAIEDRVLFATFGDFCIERTKQNNWTTVQIIERRSGQEIKKIGVVFDKDTYRTHDAALFNENEIQISGLISTPHIACYSLDRAAHTMVAISPIDERAMYAKFMEGRDLDQVAPKEILEYVRNSCLVVKEGEREIETTYKQENITVTKEAYAFQVRKITLPVIHIHLGQAFLKTALKCMRVFFPSGGGEEGSAKETELYRTKINEDAVEETILCPDSSSERRQFGIQELDRAVNRSADVDVFVSLNRMCGEVKVDQTIYRGYRFRKTISEIAEMHLRKNESAITIGQ